MFGEFGGNKMRGPTNREMGIWSGAAKWGG